MKKPGRHPGSVNWGGMKERNPISRPAANAGAGRDLVYPSSFGFSN